MSSNFSILRIYLLLQPLISTRTNALIPVVRNEIDLCKDFSHTRTHDRRRCNNENKSHAQWKESTHKHTTQDIVVRPICLRPQATTVVHSMKEEHEYNKSLNLTSLSIQNYITHYQCGYKRIYIREVLTLAAPTGYIKSGLHLGPLTRLLSPTDCCKTCMLVFSWGSNLEIRSNQNSG